MAAPWIEDRVKWLSVYMFRIVPLLSLLVYLILAVFSDSRRHEDKRWKRAWKRLLVWLAYQLTDWGPAYVISNLYLETSPREKMSIAFWVPFLLLHHARPDNISAYAMEDSKLWLRLFLLVMLKSAGSFIIVYRCILTEHTASLSLRWSSGIMLPLGILKYLESTLALWRNDMGHIRHSRLSNKQTLNLDDYRDQEKPAELEDEKALLVAHDLLEICKGAFCDYTVIMDHDVVINMFSEDRWKSMCKVVEMELSLMYDILYTKAAVVHTWHGYAIRVASPPLTATALLLFFLHCKEGMKPIDKVVSYILLWTTLFLDVRWLFRALASAWTHSYFKRKPHNWLKHEFWCRGRWAKLRRIVVSLPLSWLFLWLWTCACPKKPKSYRRLVCTFGQCNLLSQCTAGNRHNLYSIPGLGIEREGYSSSRDYEWEDHSRGLEIPDHVKKLVFSNICTSLFPDPVRPLRHARMRMRNAPPNPDHPHDEQAAEYSTDCWRYNPTLPQPYEQVNLRRHFHTGANHEGVLPDTNEKADDNKPTVQPDEDMGFPPELQEAILIWHIATDVFLLRSPTEEAENKKAINQISDYMMFLVAKRPEMLPGLTLRSLHEKTRRALELIRNVATETSCTCTTNEKEVVARWMLDNPNSAVWEGTQNRGEDNSMTTVRQGTQLAQVLLSRLDEDGSMEITEGVTVVVERLAHWIPRLRELSQGELYFSFDGKGVVFVGDMEGMLEFILDAWVRLLMFAAMRCSRDSHAKQLSYGGELTTLVWIITEHTKVSVVKTHLKSLLPLH